MNLIKPTILAAFAALSTLGAHAFQGEESNLPPAPFKPALSRAAVQAEARLAQPIGNGGTGVLASGNTAADPSIRAGARAVAAQGASLYGT